MLATVAVACTGGSDSAGTPTATPENTPARTQTATATPVRTPTSTATSAPDSEAVRDLEALIRLGETNAYAVTYAVNVTSSDPFTGEMSLYFDPANDSVRFDLDGSFGTELAAITRIGTPGRGILCNRDDEMPFCVEYLVGDEELAAAPGDGLTQFDDSEFRSADEVGSRQIAGTQTRCFEYERSDDSGIVCLDERGVVLFGEAHTPEGTTMLEAISYTETVAAEDLEPPIPLTPVLSFRQADAIDEAIELALLDVDDMAPNLWRVIEFADARFASVSGEVGECLAVLPTLEDPRGPVDGASAPEPVARGARFLFNGAIGSHGSQIWIEVSVFDEDDVPAAETALTELREAFNEDGGPGCAEEQDEGLRQSERGVVVRPSYSIPGSASYALEVRRVASDELVTRVETHVIQHGRYVGTMFLYDHAPAQLWESDGQRVLDLFDQRLRAAAEELAAVE